MQNGDLLSDNFDDYDDDDNDSSDDDDSNDSNDNYDNNNVFLLQLIFNLLYSCGFCDLVVHLLLQNIAKELIYHFGVDASYVFIKPKTRRGSPVDRTPFLIQLHQ